MNPSARKRLGLETILMLAAPWVFWMSGACKADTLEEIIRKNQDIMTAQGVVSLKEAKEELEKLREEPSDQQIIEVARRLNGLKNSDRFNELQADADLLYDEIQQTLLAMPGHAEAYGKSYWKTREEVLEGRTYHGKLARELTRFSSAFPHLRSPEMMRVLGEILEDTKGATNEDLFPGQPRKEGDGPSCGADWAVMTLHQIGIANPPVIEDERFQSLLPYRLPELREEWKRWWDEVKAGKRTYRFTGSDVEYGYEGPVEAKAPRPLRRMERGETGGPEQEKRPGEGRNGVWFAVAAVVMGACYGLLRKWKMKERPGG